MGVHCGHALWACTVGMSAHGRRLFRLCLKKRFAALRKREFVKLCYIDSALGLIYNKVTGSGA